MIEVGTDPGEIGELMAERASAQAEAQASVTVESGPAPRAEAVRLDPEVVRPVLRATLGPVFRSFGVSALTAQEEAEGAAAFAGLFGKWAPTLFERYSEEMAATVFVVGLVMVRKAEIEERQRREAAAAKAPAAAA